MLPARPTHKNYPEQKPMRSHLALAIFALALAATFCLPPVQRTHAQAGRRAPQVGNEKAAPARTPDAKPPQPAPTEQTEATVEDDDTEAVTVETNLVTVPVIVSDRSGRYIADVKQEEFTVSEDGAEQKVAFFATVSEPFHVVLMIDTSASTTTEKLRQVQDAAIGFIDRMLSGDRMKVISFDDDVRDLSVDFTGDRAALVSAIRATRPGKGTRLYDAFDMAFRALRRVRGRKAIVMLTDGVDWHSDRRTYEDNRRAIEESDIVVYPVRFDTRAETEQLARAQARGGQPVDLGTVFGGKIPGLPGGGTVVVNPRDGRTGDPRDTSSDPSRDASRGGLPRDSTIPDPNTRPGTDDTSIAEMMDRIYKLADEYLNEMARTSGGTLVRADNNAALPRAFQQIADELRTQYSLGYYPTNAAHDGKYRKIRVRTTRKDASIRTRPGYRAKK
jgi:VWFA-related protein